jgi:ornithine cyclodeaminase/alanine dehydrogenase-like protein (mu-crystallin family)
VAAKHLAHRDSRVATIVGCGVQGRVQLRALALVLPLKHAFVADTAPGAARQFAAEMSDLLGISISPIGDLAEAAPTTDVWVTCTPSHSPVLRLEHVRPGAFVAGVGADHPEKSELHPDLFGEATVVVDVIEQCLELGDLHHAVRAGAIEPGQVRAELGKIVCGLKPGRSSDSERIVFDSTGTAFQDVAAAEVAYERSLALHRGLEIALSPGQDPAPSGHGL